MRLTFLVLLAVAVVLGLASPLLRRRAPHLWWYLIGFPTAVVRIWVTWRKLTTATDLAVPRRPARGLLGDMVVKGDPLKPIPPRLGLPRPRPGALEVVVRLHPGQVPDQFAAVAEAIVHAWRVHAVRVTSDARGFVLLRATAWDPLASPALPPGLPSALLSALVGVREDGAPWVLDFRAVPQGLSGFRCF